MRWIGKQAFQLDIAAQKTGSGDTAYDFMKIFCYLIPALVAGLAWTFLDRRRSNDARIYDWLQVFVRFSLATAMIVYGAHKVFSAQFGTRGDDQWPEDHGPAPPGRQIEIPAPQPRLPLDQRAAVQPVRAGILGYNSPTMWVRALSAEDRAVLRRMSRRSPARAFLAIAFDWGLILLAAALCEVFSSPWTYFLALVVISRQMNALFELHHHAMHNNLFPRKAWNRSFQAFYSLPLWNTVESDLADHMDHHRTFNTSEPDYRTWGTGYGLDPARRRDRRYMTWFLWIRPFLGFLQASDLKELLLSKRWRDPAYWKPVALFWAATIALFLAAGRLDLLLWYWIVPRFTLFPVLFFWDDMLGHYNCPRTGTREMRGLWFRIFSTHGTNFHNIHHLYPAIPWFNMEEATGLAIDETQVDLARGFLDGMRQLAVAQD